jgi:hypothetical protein
MAKGNILGHIVSKEGVNIDIERVEVRVQHEFTNKTLRYQPFRHHPQAGEVSPEVSMGTAGTRFPQ